MYSHHGILHTRLLANFDWRLLGAVLAIGLVSVVVVNSATLSASLALGETPDMVLSPFGLRQLLWLALGMLVIAAALAADYRYLIEHSYVFWLLIVAALIGVHAFGHVVKGGERWISLGGYRFQPSEPAKIILVLVLARHYAQHDSGMRIRNLVVPCILTAIPVLLILKQPDLGTAMSMVPPFVVMTFATGLPWQLFAATAGAGLVAAPLVFYYFLHDYQRDRILAFLSPEDYASGAGYQVIQSQIAIGSGGLFGRGYLEGSQSRLNFLPERHTDFIFAVFAEEWGFAGITVLLALFGYLLYRGLTIALTAKDASGFYLALGIATLLASQATVNIAMIVGLAPVTGVPLPLMSYGGSAMLTAMLAVGLLLNVRMRRFMF